MTVNLKALVGRLDATCRNALEGAAGLCHSRTNYAVEIEHFLLKLAEPADTDLARILRQFEVDASRLIRDVTASVDRLKKGNTGAISMSDRVPQWVEAAWLIGSIDYGSAKVRSGHLVLALLAREDLAALARGISKEFNNVSVESLKKKLPEIVAGSAEERESASLGESGAAGPAGEPGAPGAAPGAKALDQYTIDLTAKA